MPSLTVVEVDELDQLLSLLAEEPQSEACRNAHEHVQGARQYLLGAMLGECQLNLELARRSAARIPDHDKRAKVERVLGNLLNHELRL